MKVRELLVTTMLMAALIVFQSCSVLNIGEEKVKNPFPKKKYESTEKYYRAVESGKSPNMSFAKEIAFNNAKELLAKKIFHDNPRNKQTQNVIHQTLKQVNVVEEKMFVKNDGTYVCWIIIETSKKFY